MRCREQGATGPATLTVRFSSREKTKTVLRLLEGESVEVLSNELGASVTRIERWKNSFVAAGSAELAKRKDEHAKSWSASHARSMRQWAWLLFAVVTVVSVLVIAMSHSSPE